jgi:hypothetical protein
MECKKCFIATDLSSPSNYFVLDNLIIIFESARSAYAQRLITMASSLEAIANSDGGDGKSKSDLYLQFLNEAVASGNFQSCSQFVDHGKIAI